ncbi:MAG: efflux RND transporter periplasmic adaptor subunit [Nitrococcus mobilis]|nr:efflux RND transporter periplasmic adaptor subunit [Nitrococcus mobilis]
MKLNRNRAIAVAVAVAGLVALAVAITIWLRASDQAASQTGPNRPQVEYQSGPFRIGVDIQPAAPVVGENRLTVAITDRNGERISGAEIKAVAEMPAMGSMPAMRAPAEMREIEPGVYRGTFDLPMEGSWPLTLRIAKPPADEARLVFDLATGRKGLRLASGARPIETADNEPTDAGALPYVAGPYRFDVGIEPEKPTVGKNTLTVRLRNKQGRPVQDADVEAVAEMPAMGSMPAMQVSAEMMEVEPGVYRGMFNLPMEGSWPLTLRFNAADAPERKVVLDMATGRSGLAAASGAVRADGGGEAVEAAPAGTVMLDARRRQLIGVGTARAQVTDLERTIRAVGQVSYDETRLADVSLKFDAWVGELYVEYVGALVKKGQPLFTVYGPELLAAQQEYLEIKRRGAPSTLLGAARKRLELWDMTAEEIAALERRGEPFVYVPIHAPLGGTVVTKNVVEGTARQAGETLMRIADLSWVWVEAEVYEAELPLVRAGMPAEVRLPYLPNQVYKGEIDYVYPYLEEDSRTGRVRITLENPNGVLKPDMYAEVKLMADLGQRLTVPEEAVIIAGETRVVFEDLGGGRLAPRRVETGQRAGGRIEILNGLEPGDQVVTSGNFLIASESRLKAGIEQW